MIYIKINIVEMYGLYDQVVVEKTIRLVPYNDACIRNISDF